jgi:hypothetical protein
MANSDKNIIITPNIGSTTDYSKIVFSGADASTAAQNITLRVYPTSGGTLSFEGSSGQLLSIANTMTGTIFSANDISGIPSIEVLDSGLVKLAQYNGSVAINTSTAASGYGLTIGGNYKIAGAVYIADTPPPNPTSGTLWWDSTYLALRIYYGGASIWIDALTAVNGQTPSITAGTDITSTTVGTTPPVVTINCVSTLQTVTSRGASSSYAITISNATNSSGYNSGALIVTGGGGFGGQVYGNSNAYFAGALGVGTTAPTTAGQIYATNSITAFYSDERLKTKISVIENALDKVDQLTGFIYTSNDLAASFGYTDQSLQVGISAQAAQKVQPEVVKPAPFDIADDGTSKSGENYLTVQYEKLVPLLIEAIKELRAEVNQLKGK